MYPPLFAKLNADSAVHAVFGTLPLRIYQISGAPAKGAAGYALPYATFQLVAGSPENYLAGRPDHDDFREQIDVFAKTLDEARAAAKVIRDSVELVAYVVSYNGESEGTDTTLASYSFDIAWLTPRT
jgi:hypothetical protein